jgi:hypothetical protein
VRYRARHRLRRRVKVRVRYRARLRLRRRVKVRVRYRALPPASQPP